MTTAVLMTFKVEQQNRNQKATLGCRGFTYGPHIQHICSVETWIQRVHAPHLFNLQRRDRKKNRGISLAKGFEHRPRECLCFKLFHLCFHWKQLPMFCLGKFKRPYSVGINSKKLADGQQDVQLSRF